MPTSLLTTFILYIIVVGVSPGPANIYSMSCSSKFGWKVSLRMWCGLALGFVIAITAIAFLTHYLGVALGEYVRYLKYLGTVYMFYLAWKLLRSSIGNTNNVTSCTFLSGMLVSLTNAKLLIFEISVFGTFVLPYSDKLVDIFEAALLLILSGPVANLLWLFAGSWLGHLFKEHQKIIDIIMSLLLVACAVVIAMI